MAYREDRFGSAPATSSESAVDSPEVKKSLFDANTILKADTDDTPEALTVAEQTVVGRVTGGEITALTAAQVVDIVESATGADKLDHGGLQGLTDDDHTQYVKHSLATTASDFLVGTVGAWVKKTLAETRVILDWAADIATHAALTTGIHGVGASTVASAADISTHASDTSTHGASDIADVSDIAVDANLSVAAQAAITASHARSHALDGTSDHSIGSLTSTYLVKSDGTKLAPATNTDAQVSGAVSASHTQGTDTALGAVSTKNPPIDADKLLYRDSTASDVLVTSTWTQVKAFLKTYWDTLYEALGAVATHAALTTGVHGAGANTLLHTGDVDDTPVDSATTAPVSSNWAYDHVAAADPHSGYRLESADHNHQSTGAQAGKIDHGAALDGLSDDDHPQYVKDTEYSAADVVLVGTGAGTFGAVTLAASQFLAKKAAGAATNVTATEARTILNVADGADVTGSNPPQAHKDSHDPNDGSDPLDTANASEIAGVQAAGTGTSHSLARADHAHAINHGITDNHIVTIDGADIADDEYARFTASGLESRTAAEVAADIQASVDHGSLAGLADDDHTQYATNVEFDDHDARHKWLAADELNIKDLLFDANSMIWYLKIFDAIAVGWTQTVSGTGTVTAGVSYLNLTSGTTDNSTAGCVSAQASYFNKDSASYRWRHSTRAFNGSTTTNESERWWGFFSDASTFPTTTSAHVAFRLIESANAGDNAAVLYASSGTGAAGTQTQIATGVGSNTTMNCFIKYMGTTITYYYNGALVATHTHGVENTPDDVNLYVGGWLKTTDTTSKKMWFYTMKWGAGAD